MPVIARFRSQLRVHRNFWINFIALFVGIHGLFILATSLLVQLTIHRGSHISNLVIDLPLLIGLSLIYLSSLLRRRKYTAWVVAVLAYGFLIGLNVAGLISNTGVHVLLTATIVRAIVLPVIILGLLLLFRNDFVVRSDAQGFRIALRFSAVILLATFIYGTAGFELLNRADFHQEISLPAAMHYTVDQFDLTTNHPVRPYSKRAHLFVDSLSVVSIGAVVYVVIALFQPLRSRFSDQRHERERLLGLLQTHPAPSEDFFKLWPRDKQYFFNQAGTAGLAFHVYGGVALCLGDPVGQTKAFRGLLQDFAEFCFGNDWRPALVHVEKKQRHLYQTLGFEMQRIGQEAVVDIAHFQEHVATNKYFRHITNKFTKQGYSCEVLKPPHDQTRLERLRAISDDWLSQGGRVERGFVMGYFTPTYLQQCDIMVLRDSEGIIQGFTNQVPATFDSQEATFDMLRQTTDSPGNSNDFLLVNFIRYAQEQGFQRLNLGLCPLVGLDEAPDDERTLIDNFLRFAYANGDRFYSFSGLYRFKSKYEPVWSDRFIAYQGGVRGFSRTMNALMRVMRVKTRR